MESSVTVSVNDEHKSVKEAPKQQPIWMSKSTVDGIPLEESNEVRDYLIHIGSYMSCHLI